MILLLSIESKKAGQPQPESNLNFELKSSSRQTTQLYVPISWNWSNFPVQGLGGGQSVSGRAEGGLNEVSSRLNTHFSVNFCCVTLYWRGVKMDLSWSGLVPRAVIVGLGSATTLLARSGRCERADLQSVVGSCVFWASRASQLMRIDNQTEDESPEPLGQRQQAEA